MLFNGVSHLIGHTLDEYEYGDGYHEPREVVSECECGERIGYWLQYYQQTPDWEQDWFDHIAGIYFEMNPSPVYRDIEADYLWTYSQLEQELIQFSRIDCGIPGVRLEPGGLF